jgi:spermidine synthase
VRYATLLGVTFVIAFCSITYELALAQSMAAVFGGTALHYGLTIGAYLAALGAGSLMVPGPPQPRDAARRLVAIELALAPVGALAPLAVLGAERAAWGVPGAGVAAGYACVLAVGFLSGMELPLLLSLGEAERGERGSFQALGVDYLGTLAGAVAFPLLLLPACGLFALGSLTGALNALCAAVLCAPGWMDRPRALRTASLLAFLALAAGSWAGDRVGEWAIRAWYLAAT